MGWEFYLAAYKDASYHVMAFDTRSMERYSVGTPNGNFRQRQGIYDVGYIYAFWQRTSLRIPSYKALLLIGHLPEEYLNAKN